MIGIQGSGVVRAVAIDAIHREAGVTIVEVAIAAEHRAMCTCQLKTRGVVIKSRRFPCGRRMALGAILREAASLVIRIRSISVVGPVTIDTVRAETCILVVQMAVVAHHSTMRPCQRKTRLDVIECRRRPSGCCVARLTGRRKQGGGVIGVLRQLIRRLMTCVALKRGVLEDTVLVTGSAGNGSVAPGKRKRRQRMVEARGPGEGVHRMTFRAIGRKAGKGMVGIRGFLKVRPVTSVTRRRSTGEPVVRCRAVAGLTVERCVPANKRKPSLLMALDHVGDLP